MSERKNIKRNKNRVPASGRALHQSMQYDYSRQKKDAEVRKHQASLFTK